MEYSNTTIRMVQENLRREANTALNSWRCYCDPLFKGEGWEHMCEELYDVATNLEHNAALLEYVLD